MKLLIQIPCFNEANTLPQVINSIPKRIPGISDIAVQLIDDACTDNSVEVARSLGVDYIVEVPGPNTRELGTAFQMGIKHALELDYDILVNIDGDNQYPTDYISDLIKPIVSNKADIVIANRKPWTIKSFSVFKRLVQLVSNLVMSYFCLAYVPDAVSGFRAFSYDALKQLKLEVQYTYTIESLMQAYKKRIRVKWLDIVTNAPTRDSHLIKSTFHKILKSGSTSLRLYFIYFPLRSCLTLILVLGLTVFL